MFSYRTAMCLIPLENLWYIIFWCEKMMWSWDLKKLIFLYKSCNIFIWEHSEMVSYWGKINFETYTCIWSTKYQFRTGNVLPSMYDHSLGLLEFTWHRNTFCQKQKVSLYQNGLTKGMGFLYFHLNIGKYGSIYKNIQVWIGNIHQYEKYYDHQPNAIWKWNKLP